MAISERKHWKHLYEEIVATEICCSCSACVVACPHKVLELLDFDPVQTDARSPFDNCWHGEEGCSLCAMACPRLDPDVSAIEEIVFGDGIHREEQKVEGPYRYKTLVRATEARYPRARSGRGSGGRPVGMGPRFGRARWGRGRRALGDRALARRASSREDVRGASLHGRLPVYVLCDPARPQGSGGCEVQEHRAGRCVLRIDGGATDSGGRYQAVDAERASS